MKPHRSFTLFVIALFLCSMLGCTHALEIKNLSAYQKNDITLAKKPVKLGLMAPAGDPLEPTLRVRFGG